MKITFILILLTALGLCVNGQGLKEVMLGDYGLMSPLFGRSEIETTILGLEGKLKVKKYQSKIANIEFRFKNGPQFTPEMADNIAQTLMKKYSNIKLIKFDNGNWVDTDDSKINCFIQPGSIETMTGVIELEDKEMAKNARAEYKKQEQNDL